VGIAVLMFPCAAASTAPRGAEEGWTRLTPPLADDCFQVFDPLRNQLILLPFRQYSNPDEEWVLDLDRPTSWRKTSAGGASPQFEVVRATTYDPAGDRILVLARSSSVPYPARAPLTVWARSLVSPNFWRELPLPSNAPPDRSEFSLVFDSKRGSYLLFGGGDSPYSLPYWNDVWRLRVDGNEVSWERLAPVGDSLTSRSRVGAIYDARRDRVVGFGGSKELSGGGFFDASNDVLALDLSPTPRWKVLEGDLDYLTFTTGCVAVWDSLSDQMIVFPRESRHRPVRALALSDLSSWSTYDTTGTEGPAVRAYFAAQDPGRDRGLVLGLDHMAHEVSLGSVPGIRRLGPGDDRIDGNYPAPGFTAQGLAFLDQAEGSVLIWSGFLTLDPAANRVMWRYKPGESPGWSKIDLAGDLPAARREAMVAHDLRRDRWLVFGGETRDSTSRALADLWAFDPKSLKWTRLDPGSETPGLGAWSSGEAAYDGIQDRLIVHGGWAGPGGGLRSDTWARSFGPSSGWQEILTPAGAPHVRTGASMVWDPAEDRMVLHGGEWRSPLGGIGFSQGLLSDTWMLALDGTARWDSLVVDPEDLFASSTHFAYLDAARGAMGVLGGRTLSGEPDWRTTTALRSLTLEGNPEWSLPDVGGAPLPPGIRAPVFDSSRDRLYAFRGFGLVDAWLLERCHPTILAPLDLEPNDPDNDVSAHGTVDVALLGTPSFDAASVDPASASLAGAPARADERSDRATIRDVNGDGWPDRLLKFDAARLAVPPQTRVLRLDARTRAGVAVIAYDLVHLRTTDRTPVRLTGDPDGPMDQARPLALECESPVQGTSRFRMSLPRAGRVVLEVFSVSGRRLLRQEVGSLEAGVHDLPPMPGGSLPAGVYLARARLGSEAVRQKFVVLP